MIVQDLSLLPFDPHTRRYFLIYVVGLLILLCAQSAAVVEAYRNMLEAYPGIGSVGTWLVLVAVLLALALTFALSGPDARALKLEDWWLSTAFAGSRAWNCALAVFLASASSFLFRFEVPHRPNDRAHLVILTSLLSMHAIIFMLRNGLRQYIVAENIASVTFSCLCLGAWLVKLSRKGEYVSCSEQGYMSREAYARWNADALALLRGIKRN